MILWCVFIRNAFQAILLEADGSHDHLDTLYIRSNQVSTTSRCGCCYMITCTQVGEGHTLESDHYIIDVDQLVNEGVAPTTPFCPVVTSSSAHMIPMVTRSASMFPRSAHMIPTEAHNQNNSHMIPRRSGDDIIKLLNMTSPSDHMTNSATHPSSRST